MHPFFYRLIFPRLAPAVLLAILALPACKKDPVYNVPARIEPYIASFLAEAAARGVDIDIEELVVEFESNLEVDGVAAAGVCIRSRKDPPVIKLDTTTVNWQSNLSAREQLVFHELGHCVLNRSHLDARLANGNYKSSMRASGEQIYGPVLNAFKRSYYMDEFFDESAPAPSWSVGVPDYGDVPPAVRTLVFEEGFSNNVGGWNTGTSASTRRTIANGVYTLEVLVPDNYYVANDLDIDATRNFDLEADYRIEGEGFAGLLWGGSDIGGGVPTFHTLFFDEDVISIGTIADGTESTNEFIDLVPGDFSTVTVRHLNGHYLFYLDGVRIDNLAFPGLNGDAFGLSFGGAAGVKVVFDNIRLYYLD